MLVWAIGACVGKASAQQALQFDVPLLVNGAFTGDIGASILDTRDGDRTNTQVTIPLERLQALIEKFTVDEQHQAWFNDDDNPEITLSQLRERGLEIAFDPGLLNIDAKIPQLGVSQISLRNVGNPALDDQYSQAKFASGLSLFARNTYTHRATTAADDGFGNTTIDILGFTSIGGFEGWSLFYEADYIQDDPEKELARQDVVLIHDNFDRGLRYSIGDIRPQVANLQSSPDLLGVSLERNYREINPFKNLNPSGRSSFTLDRAAEVSFEVNGVIVETQQLEPGSYSISDFPLINGANNVRVFLDDGTSRNEVANFSTFVDLDLLNPGLSNFGINAGVLRETGTGRSRRYGKDPVLTGFYERGISQKLTLGAQIEASENHALIGSKAIYGSRIGLLGIEAAVSNRDEIGTGFSAILRHEFQHRAKSDWLIDSDLQFNYSSDQFVDLTADQAESDSWGLDAALSFSRGTWNIIFGANARENNNLMTTGFSTSLFKSFRRFSLSMDYRYTKEENESADNRFNVSISVPLSSSTLRSAYRSQQNEYEASWSNPATRNAGIASIRRAEVSSNDNSYDAELDFGYVGSRFQIEAQHNSSRLKASDAEDTSSTNLSLAGSIGFADGKLAYGRPFSRGFMIVSPHKTLRGKKVFVNASGGRTNITSTKRLGTTLVPINQSYNEQRLEFKVDNLPVGYDIGSGDVRFFPGNLAGYRYTLGSDAANTLLGNVLWPDGTPLKLKSGKLIPTDGGKEIVVFTNRTGRFVAEKVRFGKYQMAFKKNGELYSIEVNLEERKEPGLIQTGTLTLEQTK